MNCHHNHFSRMLVGIIVSLSCLLPRVVDAEILVPIIPPNLVDVTVSVETQFDPIAQLYTYTYEVTSLSTSQQNVESFSLAVDAEIQNIQSPQGWRTFQPRETPILMWAAIEVPEEFIPPGLPDDGTIIPSPFQINPGETLGGFSFQSPAPPQSMKFYVEGFVPVPAATEEGEFNDEDLPVFPDSAKAGTTLGPGLDDSIIFDGGRRPSVDGFLAFVGNANRETRTLPIAIIIRFGVNGETVFPETFTASLNRVDVTQEFVMTGNGDERVAFFEVGSSPIEVGRNVLVTGLDGIVPGTTRTATDGDAFTFFAVE